MHGHLQHSTAKSTPYPTSPPSHTHAPHAARPTLEDPIPMLENRDRHTHMDAKRNTCKAQQTKHSTPNKTS
ncbi:hypothetical protein IAQ61_005413 [Plenodomus lingam]|uniref:uncharacterized protein n=1 Tax=Leptosphaeria maculans TaxID=5022 RepID=UPI00332C9AE8|nr:hypothetical protein IAQ61_005413 [Plenodomus lingam]